MLEVGTLSSDSLTDGADVPRLFPVSAPARVFLGDEDVVEGKLGRSHVPVSAVPVSTPVETPWATNMVVAETLAAGAEGDEAGRLGQRLLVELGSGGE